MIKKWQILTQNDQKRWQILTKNDQKWLISTKNDLKNGQF